MSNLLNIPTDYEFRSTIDRFKRTYSKDFNIANLFNDETTYRMFYTLSCDISKDDEPRCLIGRPRLILTDGKTKPISAAYLLKSFNEIKPRNPTFYTIYALLELKFGRPEERRLVDGNDTFNFISLSDRYDQLVVDIEDLKNGFTQDVLLAIISQYREKSLVFTSKFKLNELRAKIPGFIQYIEQHGKIIEFWKNNTPYDVVSKYLFIRGTGDCFFCKRDEKQYYSRFGTQELKNMAKKYRLNEQELREEVLKQSLKFLENKENID